MIVENGATGDRLYPGLVWALVPLLNVLPHVFLVKPPSKRCIASGNTSLIMSKSGIWKRRLFPRMPLYSASPSSSTSSAHCRVSWWVLGLAKRMKGRKTRLSVEIKEIMTSNVPYMSKKEVRDVRNVTHRCQIFILHIFQCLTYIHFVRRCECFLDSLGTSRMRNIHRDLWYISVLPSLVHQQLPFLTPH